MTRVLSLLKTLVLTIFLFIRHLSVLRQAVIGCNPTLFRACTRVKLWASFGLLQTMAAGGLVTFPFWGIRVLGFFHKDFAVHTGRNKCLTNFRLEFMGLDTLANTVYPS